MTAPGPRPPRTFGQAPAVPSRPRPGMMSRPRRQPTKTLGHAPAGRAPATAPGPRPGQASGVVLGRAFGGVKANPRGPLSVMTPGRR